MFEVKDKKDNILYIQDKIRHEHVSEHGDEVEKEGIVISFPSEEEVQYQPIGEGLPVICLSKEVVQVDSLVARALSLVDDVDFQELITEAGQRYLEEVAAGKKRKAGKKGAQAQVDQRILSALERLKKKD
jgi:hypothetical protein